MRKLLEKCAAVLVGFGYAERQGDIDKRQICYYRNKEFIKIIAEPFSDTLEGRRQADAIEDYLKKNNPYMFFQDANWHNPCAYFESSHKYRLAKIKWCIKELIK